MRRRGLNTLALQCLGALLCLGLLVACGTPSPEEQVASLRSQYTVELVSWRLEQIPQESDDPLANDTLAVASEMGAETEVGTEDSGETLEVPEHLQANLTNNVFLDVLVGTGSTTTLDTLTLDITHAAATQAVKHTYRVALDVSDVARAAGSQITTSLEDLSDFEEGDLFSVEVRANVPAEERSSYVEFGT